LPQWFLDEPHLYPGDVFYLKAFFDLSTCRQSGMGLGPIPWHIIVQYAKFYQLEEDVTEAFIDVIREMDTAFLEKNQPQDKPKPITGSKNKVRRRHG